MQSRTAYAKYVSMKKSIYFCCVANSKSIYQNKIKAKNNLEFYKHLDSSVQYPSSRENSSS